MNPYYPNFFAPNSFFHSGMSANVSFPQPLTHMCMHAPAGDVQNLRFSDPSAIHDLGLWHPPGFGGPVRLPLQAPTAQTSAQDPLNGDNLGMPNSSNTGVDVSQNSGGFAQVPFRQKLVSAPSGDAERPPFFNPTVSGWNCPTYSHWQPLFQTRPLHFPVPPPFVPPCVNPWCLQQPVFPPLYLGNSLLQRWTYSFRIRHFFRSRVHADVSTCEGVATTCPRGKSHC